MYDLYISSSDQNFFKSYGYYNYYIPKTVDRITMTTGDASNIRSTREIFSLILSKLYQQTESIPFKESVSTPLYERSDSLKMNSHPTDLAVIRAKLEANFYTDPWNFVNDVWLMFENAWLYNKESSKVYKSCTLLADIFSQEINACMRKLGFCCGQRYVFDPLNLHCFGKTECIILKNAKYYSYQKNEYYVFCVKCFKETPGDSVTVMGNSAETLTNLKKIYFLERKNDRIESELFIKCTICNKKFHRICVIHFERTNSDDFACDNCVPSGECSKRKVNDKYAANRLPTTVLSDYIQKRLDNYLKEKIITTDEVTVRVVSSFGKITYVKPEMKKRFVDGCMFPEKFPYTAKTLLVFQKIENLDVCIFGMLVQEYGSECPGPNNRRVYISYLDSVNYFNPKQFRTEVYHEIILGYLDYVKRLGYTRIHVWACPPPEGDDYIFHRHPKHQKLPDHKRLEEWYRQVLDKGKAENIILCNENIKEQMSNGKLSSILELPYFENDFWPNILEENIKILNSKEEQLNVNSENVSKRIKEDCVSENKPTNTADSMKENRNVLHYEAELTDTVYSSYKKHDEVFFIFKLHLEEAESGAILSPIKDPDPFINCEFMNGRDNFLLFLREKHLEFSTLRRAKYSSAVLLYEILYSKNQDKFVYICNVCKNNLGTRYHCTICPDLDLCITCWCKENHRHEMRLLGTNQFVGYPKLVSEAQIENKQIKNKSIDTCATALMHACLCRDKNCNSSGCTRMKRVLSHFKLCTMKTNDNCSLCKQLITVCWYHAKHCRDKNCMIPPCSSIKCKLKEFC